MSIEESSPEHEEIRYLPESPVVYLSMMRTQDGIPRGTPIWSSFEDKSHERSMENESMASTFLSLSKSISDMALDSKKDGKVIRLNVNNKTYNIYIPHPDDNLQVCFVIVFEESEEILVKDKYKTELVRLVAETLRSIDEFRSFLDDDMNIRLNKRDHLYDRIFEKIVTNIKRWDNKRVEYLIAKEEARRRMEEEQRRIKEQKDNATDPEQADTETEDEKIGKTTDKSDQNPENQ